MLDNKLPFFLTSFFLSIKLFYHQTLGTWHKVAFVWYNEFTKIQFPNCHRMVRVSENPQNRDWIDLFKLPNIFLFVFMLLFKQEASYMFSIILGGIIGGALRGIMGIAKSLILKKEEQINYGWFFVSVAVAMAIGIIAASLMGGGLEIALLAGYAGSDLLESLVKLKFKEKWEKAVSRKVHWQRCGFAGQDGWRERAGILASRAAGHRHKLRLT